MNDKELRDLHFVQHPHWWPDYPVLPMIRRGDGKAGFIWAGDDPIVYHANVWGLPSGTFTSITKDLPKSQFESFTKLVEEWRVD